MHSMFIQYVYLILIILALVMIANKLRLAYPIVLVLGGLVLSFTTKFSNIDLKSLNQELEESNGTEENPSKNYRSIYLELLEQQRQLLNEMNRSAEFDEELIRKYLSLMDLDEFKIREKQLQEADSE